MTDIRFFDKRTLAAANAEAITAGRNRSLRVDLVETLPVGRRFPVVMTMPHDDGDDVRVGITVPSPGFDEPIVGVEAHGRVTVFLDISVETYNNLPIAVVGERRAN